jgi:hypothetical protein
MANQLIFHKKIVSQMANKLHKLIFDGEIYKVFAPNQFLYHKGKKGELTMKEITPIEERGKSGCIYPLAFDCQAPLKFYEHCAKCARFSDDCPYLKMGLELLHKKKKLRYNAESRQ